MKKAFNFLKAIIFMEATLFLAAYLIALNISFRGNASLSYLAVLNLAMIASWLILVSGFFHISIPFTKKFLKRRYLKIKFQNRTSKNPGLLTKARLQFLFHFIWLFQKTEDGYGIVKEEAEAFYRQNWLFFEPPLKNTAKKIAKNQKKDLKTLHRQNRIRASFVSLLFLAVVIFSGLSYLAPSFTSKAADFAWTQTDWSGGATANTATHETDQTGWTEFANKDDNLDTSTPGEISAQNTSEENTYTTNSDFEQGTADSIDITNDSIELSTCGNSIQDTDGNTYDTVKIGDQCWMAENLNVGEMDSPSDDSTIQKYCYDGDESNCDTDGGLYDWDEAMQYTTTEGAQGICPSGWHIPTDDEWHTLEDYLTADGNSCSATRDGSHDCDPAGSKLAGNVDGLSWDSGSTIANHSDFDSSGFNAPPSGNRYTSGGYYNRSSNANFWSSSESGSTAWRRYLYDGRSAVSRNDYDKATGGSVRCLKD